MDLGRRRLKTDSEHIMGYLWPAALWMDWDLDVTRQAGRLREEEWNVHLRPKLAPADGRCGSCGAWLDDRGDCPDEAYGCEEWAVDEAERSRLRMRYEDGDVECVCCGHRMWSADATRRGAVICRACRS